MPATPQSLSLHRHRWLWLAVALLCWVSCGLLIPRQGWDPTYGPVVPHDSFPGDCKLCHDGADWHTLKADFAFDHLKETGYELRGAHQDASCLLCHNDRGPVAQFANKGCAGCHDDIHRGALGTTCTSCHEERTWRPADLVAKHSMTRFPLAGPHAAAACFRCHPGAQVGNFEGLSPACENCHQQDLARATNPDHAAQGWTKDCQQCHIPVAWQPARFQHPPSFPLSGGHAAIACASCHTGSTFAGLTTGCVACHTDDFARTANPNHPAAGFSSDCTTCHDTRSFATARFNHPASFQLTQGHGGRQCAQCHQGEHYAGTSTECVSCHLQNWQNTTAPNHPAASMGQDCQTCHNTAIWQSGSGPFQHPPSFPLTQSHNTACNACHTGPNVYVGLSPDCASCHLTRYTSTTSPSHIAAGYPTDCRVCHGTAVWQGARFEHPASMPLTNGHATSCVACHTSPGTYAGLSAQCNSCHLDDYNRTTVVPHATSGFPQACQQCHNTVTWTNANYPHTASFPLTGSHVLACNQCHTTPGVFSGLTKACASCHQTRYSQTTNPHHAPAGFGTQCQQCHTTSTWLGVSYQHVQSFPLTQAHAGRQCRDCHQNAVYQGLPRDCLSCHQQQWAATTNPPHAQAGFPTNCTQCHSLSTWQGASFTHIASFPLTNGHAGRSCNDCHSSGVYQGLPNTCVSCHQGTVNQVTNPNHTAAGFGPNCTQCHSTSHWTNANYTHPASFPLTQGHAGRTCNDCHGTGVYHGLPTTCISCHQQAYNQSTNPPHAQAGFPTNCTQCHSLSTWQGASFTHIASFPLTNGHAGRSCNDCHSSGVYQGLPNTCVSCHQGTVNQVTNPNHTAAGFGPNCTQCHSTSHWTNANYTHPASFPLTQGHAGRTCNDCHGTGVYHGLPTTCISCHQQAYNQSTNPPHAQAGFPTNCTQCHSLSTWQGASFTHIASFPLTNGHAGRSCNDCHSSGVYHGLPTTCVSCHQTNYNQTTNPHHTSLGFPTNCTLCHGTTRWTGATFTHTASFPLTNGHAGRQCVDCHSSGVYQGLPNNCVSCHQTRYNQTTNPHHQAAGFATTCNQCHSTSNWTSATYQHPASFPLTSGHAGRQCSDCHSSGVYHNLPSTCVSCHITAYNQTTNPDHRSYQMATTCQTCHTTTAWQPANLVHPFPRTGRHNVTCTECHNNAGNRALYSCIHCHAHSQSSMANEHGNRSGYQWVSTACYNCHPNGRG